SCSRIHPTTANSSISGRPITRTAWQRRARSSHSTCTSIRTISTTAPPPRSMSTRIWRTSAGTTSRGYINSTHGEQGAIVMRRQIAKRMMVLGVLVAAAMPEVSRATDPDWKTVEQALGKAGQVQAGGVYRVGIPRTDLAVTVKGVPVKAGFALGSYAAFKQIGDHAMVMGDLVLLDQEVPAVMSGLFAGGLNVTAVHNHLNEMTPHVM